MKIFITGANGFVGKALSRFLIKEGHQVTTLIRSQGRAKDLPDEVSCVVGESTIPGKWQKFVSGHDVLINLAGATIFKRWNEKYKRLIRDSRLLTTANLVDAIPEGSSDVTLLSTSAVGYYGPTGDEDLSEESPPGSDFLATLARDWESEALKAEAKGVRVVIHRFGIVLGKGEGALAQMVLPFRFFVGGPLGSGRQWFSWIHIEDLCRAASFVIHNPDIRGPVNFVAPQPVRNKDLARAIGKILKRPAFMPAPGFMIRLVMGEFGSVILSGQKVLPRVLQARGFQFNYPNIDTALANLLRA